MKHEQASLAPWSSSYILAVDLGTSGPKVALFTLEGGIVSASNREIPLILSADGGGEQDPQAWWRAIGEAMHEVLAPVSLAVKAQIVAIGTTAQWSGTVALSSSGTPLMNSIIWMDARGAAAMQRLCGGRLSFEGYGLSKLAQWVYQTGGAPGLSGKDSLAHILLIRERFPEIYRQTAVFLEPKDYLNFLFTGKIASSLDTMALHWVTNNRDLTKTPRYASRLLALAGLEREKLPPLLASTSILGNILPSLAREFGLSEQLKVVVGSPDIPSAAVGSGAISDYQAHLCLGTSSWITCHVPFKKTGIVTKMATLPSAVPGRYFVANEQESAAYCLQYLRQLLAGEGANAPLLTFAEMEAEAELSPPGAKSLLFTPWLNGERTPVDDHALRGGFHHLRLEHRRSELVRAVYEGVAFNSRWLKQAVEAFIGRPIRSLHLIGGGAQSRLWCQILADVLGCEIKQIAAPRHANARGAAWLAAAGLGLLSFDEMEEKTAVAEVFTPHAQHRGLYDRLFGEFLALHRATKQIHQRLHRHY